MSKVGRIFPLLLLLAVTATAQRPNQSLDAALNQVRADLQVDKAAIVSTGMNMNAKDADKFWPVYKQYEAEVEALNDQVVQLVKQYDRQFGSIQNKEATQMAQTSFDLQARRIDLKKKYFPILAKATSPLMAAKFFQIEYRTELMFYMKLASELPGLWVQPIPDKN
jgi:hypothetical protein